MTRTTTPRPSGLLRSARPVNTLIAVSASLALLLSACGDSERDAVSTVAVTAVAGSPEVIHLGPGGGKNAAGDAAVDPSTSTRLAWIEYVLGTDLPALDGTAPAWVLRMADADPAAIAAVARALGLEGDVVQQSADYGGGWIIGSNDGTGPSLNVSKDGMLSWWYSSAASVGVGCAEPGSVGGGSVDPVPPDAGTDAAGTEAAESNVAPTDTVSEADKPSGSGDGSGVDVAPSPDECVTPEAPSGVPTADEAESLFRELLVTLGVDAGQVEFETYADEWTASVTGYLVLDGIRSPLSFGATYGADGELMWANGMLASPERIEDYPRIGAQAGFERLQNGGWWGGIGVRDAIAPAETSRGGGDAAATDEAISPMPPDSGEPMKVVITGVDEELWMVWDVDGTVWLLPGYAFTTDDGGRYSVPAVPDEFIQIDEPIAIDDPLPVDSMPVEPLPVDSGPAVPPEEPVAPAPDPVADEFPLKGGVEALVGMTEEDATTAITLAQWTARVVARDGEQFAVTMDYRTDRVNLEIVDGVVTAATIG